MDRQQVFYEQLMERSRVAFDEHTSLVSYAVLLVAILLVPLLVRRPRRVSPWLTALLTAPVVYYSLKWAWQLRWIADDAFISFRYAENLLAGNGLVLNPGEYVEGYTNFLWTMLVVGGMALGAHPVQASVVLSLGAMGGAIAVATVIARRMPGGQRVVVSFAALGLGASYGFATYGTSGLETMLGALLVLVGVERAQREDYFGASLATVAATMCHPDHILFWGALFLAVALRIRTQRESWTKLGWYLLPLTVLVGWTAWRYWYYGDLLPCTYYAKSGGGAYFEQGYRYLVVSAVASGVVGAVPLFVYGVYRGRNTLLVRFTVLQTLLYLPYVAKIGGDFMLARLLVPWIGPFLLVAEHGARDLMERKWPLRIAAIPVVLLLVTLVVPNRIIRPGEKWFHVADERTFYRMGSFFPPKVSNGKLAVARELERYFVKRGLRPRLGIGSMGIIAFETDLPIFDTFGLTEPSVAHMKLKKRGRPGHEKLASPGHLLEGDVDMADIPIYPGHFGRLSDIRLGHARFHLAKFDPVLFDQIRREPRTRITDYRHHLDGWVRRPPPAGPSMACELWFMDQYYFRHTSDPRRRDAVLDAVVRQDPSLAPVREFLLAEPPPGWVPSATFGFDDRRLPGWTLSGTATKNAWREETHVPGQGAVYGQHGQYVSTYDPELGDAAIGSFGSPEFLIDGDALSFVISGGNHPRTAVVRLWVEGRVVRSATGCNTELMGRRVWDVAPWRGKRGHIQIVDAERGSWGHVAVDELVLWKR